MADCSILTKCLFSHIQFRKMKKQTYLLLLFTLLLGSCSSLDEINIDSIKKYDIKTLKDNELKVDITLVVDNPTFYPITIKEFDLRTQINGRYIGRVNLDEAIKIHAKRKSEVTLPVTLKISNVMATAFIMLKMKDASKLVIDIEGKGQARSLLISKDFEIKESIDLGKFSF